eukprot:CAMPEP_0181235358 /NCGR_PEP_ID=MMETSP1096-20121128/37531_1 /TAXON_ID=156174 ORGANISM="Chrysochromulina ericina, Strain CCMP281" /NCGR_SAMPLE_ID=MMETSP1096 /ASSEMBLY_ACC=CAM_ASM_000453 /LENGTH=49 /DNA_ID=CAMNT_0023330329 /DNA_START=80 /DNA_END=229 /DNA_ORIENTATION=+
MIWPPYIIVIGKDRLPPESIGGEAADAVDESEALRGKAKRQPDSIVISC